MKKVIIIGAGPAGLTAGYDLLSKSSDYEVTIVEESPVVGGLCARLESEENVLDAGGHMFISKNPAVKNFWTSILPAQGVPSKDDKIIDRYCKIHNGGPDPDVEEDVILSREKLTRIYKDNKFYESPIKFNKDAVKNFGIATSIKSGFSQIGGNVFKHKETSLEDYYINRFGKQLYQMFIEEYLEKIWGREPSRINADFGPVSEKSLIAPIISADKNKDYEKLPAPYAARYYYPKYGAYQMWETVADRFIEMGGSIHKNCKVTGVTVMNDKIHSVRCCADGDEFVVNCDYLISSMPVRDLILGMDNADPAVSLAAENLSYRGMVSVCVELTEIKWKNDTEDYKTVDNAIPDSVIYVSNPNVKVSRIQVYNNFSPYMVRNSEHFYLGLNYYCNEGDYYWSMGNRDWKKTVVNDLLKLGIIDSEDKVVGYNKTKFGKAFPAYYDGYDNLDKIKKYLNKFENLYCVGRNGQHRFSSIDESMKTSFEAVKNIVGYVKSKDNIWDVNEKSDGDDGKAYNSALLSGEGEYRGNYVPLQKKIEDNGEGKEYVPPRRMRRPMMTPIKKGDPNKLSEPIILNDSVVIAARPEKSIPITSSEDEPMDVALTMEELNNIDSAFENKVEPVPAMPVAVEANEFETPAFEETIIKESYEKVNDFENESVFETVVPEETAEFSEETPAGNIDEFAAFAESIDGERLEADPDDEEEEETVIGYETFENADAVAEETDAPYEEVAEEINETAEEVPEEITETTETAEENVEVSEETAEATDVTEETEEISEETSEETSEAAEVAEETTEVTEETAETTEAAEETDEATEEVAETEELVKEVSEEITETAEASDEAVEVIEETAEVTEEVADAEEIIKESAEENVVEKLTEVNEEVKEDKEETILKYSAAAKSEDKRENGRFVSPIALASEFGNSEERESEESTDSISLPGGGRSVFSRRTRNANNRTPERWQRNEKSATKFGKTYNFVNDIDETERLVTREQAKGGDTESLGVSFNRVEKFKTDDVVDSTNPHERVIMKENNSDSPRTELRVTSRFKNEEKPEEIEKERLNCPIFADKDEDDELSKILAIPIEKSDKKMPEFVPGNTQKGDIEEVSVDENKEAVVEAAEVAEEVNEEISFEEPVTETIEEAVEETIEESVEESAEEVALEESAEITEETTETIEEEKIEEPAEEIAEETTFEEPVEENVAEAVEESVEEVTFEEPAEVTEETVEAEEAVEAIVEESTEETIEESVEEANEEVSFEEPTETVEEVTEETTEEVAFEEPAEAVEEVIEAVVEATEEPAEEIAEEVAFEETAPEATEESTEESVEESTEEVSFEEPVSEVLEAEEPSFEETGVEDSAFAEAAENALTEKETEDDDLLHINEQAASRSIVKSWQNKYNGVGAPAKEDNSNERVVNRGDISSELYGESFAASLKGKRGVMDYMLDDLDGGKEYVMRSKPESSTQKPEEAQIEKTESAPKDLSSYQIIKESGFRYDSGKNESVKTESAPSNNDSISPSPVKPLGERRPDYYKKEIDTSIVFKNARVIKSTKITREPEEDTHVKVERKETVFSDKQKVIAVIRNGEVIPVKDNVEEKPEEEVKPVKSDTFKSNKKSKKGKKGKNKKEAAETSEEIMQAPISVMLDAKEAAEMTEPLESPIVRNRNVKL